ncbi:acetone carboxylase subunit gamma [Chloroflexota bacterium]
MGQEISYSKDVIRDLIDGKLPWEETKRIMSGLKDSDRFDKYVAILQERVGFEERVLLPLSEHLYIVEKGEERIVKCDCGYEYGDYRENWKLKALIEVLATEGELDKVYPGFWKPDAEFCEIRRYYCPGCGVQLEVESLPCGYPILFDFLPDIDAFYTDWLGRPLPTTKEFKDLSYDFISRSRQNK